MAVSVSSGRVSRLANMEQKMKIKASPTVKTLISDLLLHRTIPTHCIFTAFMVKVDFSFLNLPWKR